MRVEGRRIGDEGMRVEGRRVGDGLGLGMRDEVYGEGDEGMTMIWVLLREWIT